MKQLKNLIRAIKTVFSISPFHTILMFLAGEAIAFTPLVGAIIAKDLFSMISRGDPILNSKGIILLVAYFAYFLSLKFYLVYFQRVFIQFHTMPVVEKRMRDNLHRVMQEIPIDNNEDPDFSRRIWAAKVSSINVFRLMESGFLAISIVTSLLLLGQFVIKINPLFFLFLLLTAISTFMKSYIEGVDKSKIQIQRTKLEHKQKESQSVLETVDNYKEIKNFQAFDFFYDNWEQITNTLRDLIFKTDLRILLKKSVFILIESMSYAFLFLIAIRSLADKNLDFGSFMATIQITQNLQLQLQRLLDAIGNISKFSLWTEPYYEFLELREKMKEREIDFPIEFKNVSYVYPTRSQPAIDDISFNLQAGKKIAFVGLNGAGKSTLVKMLIRHLQPSKGLVTSNGKNLDSQDVFTPTSYTALFQEACHYEVNLLENIRFGNSQHDEEIELGLKKFSLDKIKKDIPLGLDFGSYTLSGGEWQKIGLLRCFQKHSPFVILDEPSSAIDPIQESSINDYIETNAGSNTLIIVTHRLSITKLVDFVYLLDNGRILESGTHLQLLNQKHSLYRKMWDAQMSWYVNK